MWVKTESIWALNSLWGANPRKLLFTRRDFLLALSIFLLNLITFIVIFVLLTRNSPSPPIDWVQKIDCASQLEETPRPESPNRRQLPRSATNYLDCEVINLAMVCGGYNSTRNFYTLLKSILFYRVGARINLHLFVDNISSTILRDLFRTWKVPDLEVNYYNLTNYKHEVAWILGPHYSHDYGLLKLVVPTILADKGLRRVLILDTDMLAVGNIRNLWDKHTFMDSSGEGFLALVENQSDWYLDERAWPAIGRGFNTGMILMDLVKFKRANWTQMWRQVADMELITRSYLDLADQDIYNAVIKKFDWIMAFKLSCNYNLQINDNTRLSKTCPHFNRQSFQLIHWNSPHKLATKNELASYFRNWHRAFRNWSGRLLERSGCPTVIDSGGEDEDKRNEDQSDEIPMDNFYLNPMSHGLNQLCQDIRPGPYERVRSLLYMREFELYNGSAESQVDARYDITLSVHLSFDRMQALDELASHWPGPISAAIYLSEAETESLDELLQLSENLAPRKNIGLHLAFKDVGVNYPINFMRNLALNNTLTPYVFLLDVDFLPSKNAYTYLLERITYYSNDWKYFRLGKHIPLDKFAFVIPAFETTEYKFDWPENKTALRRQTDLGKVSVFREQLWLAGQDISNYEKWWRSTEPYRVDWAKFYEPYIVVHNTVARYDERFVGFGWNKVAHITWLAAQEYEFMVMTDAFIIHKPHQTSTDIIKYRNSARYQACIKRLLIDSRALLHQEFPDFFDNHFGYHPPQPEALP